MQLLQCWKDSLSIFLPKNFKLFSLVTLKSLYQSFKLLGIYGLPFVILFITQSFIVEAVLLKYNSFVLAKYDFLIRLFFLLLSLLSLSVMMLLIIRPSVKRKTLSYFYDYIVGVFYGITFSSLLLLSIFNIFKNFFLTYLNIVLIFFLIPIVLFSGLFYFDSKQRLQDLFLSLLRGFKMMIYSYPFCFIVGCFISMGAYISSQVLYGNQIIVRLFLVCVLMIVISVFTNFYIKKVHDQFNLYYKG